MISPGRQAEGGCQPDEREGKHNRQEIRKESDTLLEMQQGVRVLLLVGTQKQHACSRVDGDTDKGEAE